MILLLALVNLAEAQQPAPPVHPETAAYLILGDELRRARIERLIDELAAKGVEHGPNEADGLYYVGCVSAWRGNSRQAEDCIRSRLPHRKGAPLVVLNSYPGEARQDVTTIICIGRGGSGRALLRQRVSSGDVKQLRHCFEDAQRNAGAPGLGWYSVRSTGEFEFEDVAQARSSAASVLRIAVDHVGVPRGSAGSCLVQGRVNAVVKGAGLTPRGRIEASVPCGSVPTRGGRRLHMGELREGTFANLYLSSRHVLLDYEALPAQTRGP